MDGKSFLYMAVHEKEVVKGYACTTHLDTNICVPPLLYKYYNKTKNPLIVAEKLLVKHVLKFSLHQCEGSILLVCSYSNVSLNN